MKRSFFRFCLFACVVLFCVTCSRSEKLSDNEFLIEGKISGVEDGAVIMLIGLDGDGSGFTQDTLKNGRFMFSAETVSNPQKMAIISFSEGYPNSEPLSFWVASGKKTTIIGKDKLLHIWEVKSSVPYQKEENRYANSSRNIIREMAGLNTEINNLRTKAQASSSSDEAIVFNKTADSLGAISTSLKIKEFLSDMDIMSKTNISPIWIEKMSVIASRLRLSNNYDELRPKAELLFDKMSEEDKTTPKGYQITSYLFPPQVVEIGDDMVDTEFFDGDGNAKHFSDYSGKYLFLNFWSSSCGYCIMSLPELKEVSENYHENLTVISISLDIDAKWKDAMDKYDMPWVNLRDPKGYGGLIANYGIGTPYNVIISPDGKVLDKWMGYGNGYFKSKATENIK